MTDKELKEIELRVKRATPAPWISCIEGRDFSSGSSFIMRGTEAHRYEDLELIGATEADQDFIAAARQDIPHLIAEIHRLKSLLSEK